MKKVSIRKNKEALIIVTNLQAHEKKINLKFHIFTVIWRNSHFSAILWRNLRFPATTGWKSRVLHNLLWKYNFFPQDSLTKFAFPQFFDKKSRFFRDPLINLAFFPHNHLKKIAFFPRTFEKNCSVWCSSYLRFRCISFCYCSPSSTIKISTNFNADLHLKIIKIIAENAEFCFSVEK